MPAATGPARRRRPEHRPAPESLGLTEPNDRGRRYWHGTLTAYQAGGGRCQQCKNAVAAYPASRRARGRDQPRAPRTVAGDGHISSHFVALFTAVGRSATSSVGPATARIWGTLADADAEAVVALPTTSAAAIARTMTTPADLVTVAPGHGGTSCRSSISVLPYARLVTGTRR